MQAAAREHITKRARARVEGSARRRARSNTEGAGDRSTRTVWPPRRGRARADDPRPHRGVASAAGDRSMRAAGAPQGAPVLNPASRAAHLSFTNASLRDILNFIGTTTGINITYDAPTSTRPTRSTARRRDARAGAAADPVGEQLFYKVLNRRTIVIARTTGRSTAVRRPGGADVLHLARRRDGAVAGAQHDHAHPGAGAAGDQPNKTANTITVRATAAVVAIIERIIARTTSRAPKSSSTSRSSK